MLKIQNKSMQSFDIYFQTEIGAEAYWLQPGNSIVVPEGWITEQVKLMERRRILKITKAD